MLPDFEKQTGHKVTVENDTAGALTQRIWRRRGVRHRRSCRPPTLEPLSAEGKVVDESMTPFGKVGIGVAVALGAPQPDIGSVEGLRRTLLAARTVAYIDPASGGTSGIYLARLFQQMGIASADAGQERAGAAAGCRRARWRAARPRSRCSRRASCASCRRSGSPAMLPEAVQNWTVYAGALSPRGAEQGLPLTSAPIRASSRC